MRRINGKSLTEAKANEVARDLVRSRLKTILKTRIDEPLKVGLFTRLPGSPESFDLCHDFSRYFSGRTARAGTYRKIEKALLDTAGSLVSVRNTAAVLGRGNAALPVGVLYGAIFSPLSGLRVSWIQSFSGGGEDRWSLSSGSSGIGLKVRSRRATVGSEEVVLALGVSAEIEAAVGEFVLSEGIEARSFIYASIDEGAVAQGESLSPQDGLSIVLQAVQAVRDEVEETGMSRVRLHVFLACPLGMAVILGQKLNTLSMCIIYEHHPDRRPCYERVHAFSPSDYGY